MDPDSISRRPDHPSDEGFFPCGETERHFQFTSPATPL